MYRDPLVIAITDLGYATVSLGNHALRCPVAHVGDWSERLEYAAREADRLAKEFRQLADDARDYAEESVRLIHVEQYLLRIGMAAKSGDPERAHSLEDELYHAVLVEVAKSETYTGELARAALKSRTMTFPRRCA